MAVGAVIIVLSLLTAWVAARHGTAAGRHGTAAG
jgi:hypothetical protein